jgi:hypothetical protein
MIREKYKKEKKLSSLGGKEMRNQKRSFNKKKED